MIMIYSWMISWSVLQEPSGKVLAVLYPDDGIVKEKRESVGRALVLDDQPGGEGQQGWVGLETFL